jgi:hypothetical protein
VKRQYWLLIIAALFFITYAYGNFLPPYWRAPDETANIFFSKFYAENYVLNYYEPLNDITYGGVGPRHSRTSGATIYPAGFIGMYTTYGLFERLIPNSLFFTTSIFGVLSVLFIYLIAREVINEEYAFISAILLFFTAPLWYFSTVMYNNIAALGFFCGGCFYLMKALQENKWQQYILAGIFFGATILMRYEFLLFITISIGIAFASTPLLWKKANRFIVIGIIMLIFFTPVLIFNKKTLDNPFNVSYMSLIGEQKETFIEKMQHKFKAYLLPNQFYPERIRESASRYIFRYFVPFWILAIPGLIIALQSYRKELKKHKSFLIFLAAYLLLVVAYFGSGRFHGYNATPPIIHSSFVRYWIGWYVIAMLLCAFIATRVRNSIIRTLLMVLLISVNLTLLFHPQQGMLANYDSTHEFNRISLQAAELTEENALIFGSYWGKWVFPRRKMTEIVAPAYTQFDAQNFTNVLCRLNAEDVPVYIIPGGPIPPPETLQPYINATCGLDLTFVSGFGNGLYKATPVKQ